MADSSWIKNITHEEPSTLHVHTHTGKHYAHAGVSKEKFEQMKNSKSLGEFFNKHIRTQHPGRAV
jgi:hypothetical protein